MGRLKDILRRLLTTHAAWPILLALALLCVASLTALGVAAPEKQAMQQRFYLAGFAVVLLALIPSYEALGRMAYALMGGVVVLLVLVLFTEPINGSRRWFNLGVVNVQPSEVAKIAYVLALAWYLRYRKDLRELSGLMGPFMLTAIPAALIYIEPDLGTALLFPITLFAVLIAAGARLRHLAGIVVIAALLVPGAYPFLKPYQQERIKDAIIRMRADHPAEISAHLKGSGYQGYISQVAIGSGGTWGSREDPGAQVLPPEAETDCIFSVVGRKWGFAGTSVVVLLYMAFLAAAMEIAASTKDPFGRLTAVGLATMIVAQAYINIAMMTGLGPIVGIALPLMSYGGSSLLTNLLAVGILLNISVRRNAKTTSLPAAYAAA